MAIRTSFTELFHVDHPLVLAPMGGVSGGALAAAVSEAGGLGLVGGGYGDPLERDPEAVLGDVLDGYVSLTGARDDYGVVIDEYAQAVDIGTTEKLRQSRLVR